MKPSGDHKLILYAAGVAVVLALAAIAFFATGCGSDAPCTVNVYAAEPTDETGTGCHAGAGGDAGSGGNPGSGGAAGEDGGAGEGGAGGEDCAPHRW